MYSEGFEPIYNYVQYLKQYVDKDVIVISASNQHENLDKMNKWLRWIYKDVLEIKVPYLNVWGDLKMIIYQNQLH